MTSKFESWFRKQFGPPPKRPLLVCPKSSAAAVYMGENHAEYINKAEEYAQRKDAALKGWCARP
jgi:hypothetical protein